MKNHLFRRLVFTIFLILLCSCSTLQASSSEKYGIQKTAALQASDMVFGKYPDGIPANFSLEEFRGILKESMSEGRYSDKHYNALIDSDYRLKIISEEKCYVLCVCTTDMSLLIFCHRSCINDPGKICSPKNNHSCEEDTAKIFQDVCIKDNH